MDSPVMTGVARPVGAVTIAVAAARAHARDAGAGALTFVVVTSLAASEGGFFPDAWGWSALGCLLVAIAILVLDDCATLAPLERWLVASFLVLVAWIGCSALWSASTERSIQATERATVYASALLALFLMARDRSVTAIAAGIAAAATTICSYSLATRLMPDLFGYQTDGLYRLARPIGYWNGLALLAVIGALIALGIIGSAAKRAVRVAAAGALPILLLTLYFAFSRGGWAALALGVVILTFLQRPLAGTRLAVVGALAVSGLTVALASQEMGLVRQGTSLSRAAVDGHRLATALPILVAAAGFGVLAVDRAYRGVGPVVVLAAELTMAAAIATGAVGSYGVAHEPPSHGAATTLQQRLVSPSTSSRADYWRVAWREFEARPLLGSGADTFELYWNRERPLAVDTRFAHNLYLETLAELGPVGLLALMFAVIVPFVALRRGRRHPLAPALAAAYAASVAHAAIDWDWQLPGVYVAGILSGAGVVLAARHSESSAMLRRTRVTALVVASALASFAAVTWFGNRTLSLAGDALAKNEYMQAAQRAEEAGRWQPWASEPWRQLGIAQIALRRPAAAHRSFLRAVARDPLDWETWYDLSLVSNGAERTHAFNRARRLNPLSGDLRSPP